MPSFGADTRSQSNNSRNQYSYTCLGNLNSNKLTTKESILVSSPTQSNYELHYNHTPSIISTSKNKKVIS